MAELDYSTIIGAVVLAASNLGAAKLLLTRSLDRQDKMDEKLQKHGELMSETAQTLKETVKTQAEIQTSVKELFESRNELKEAQVAVDTLHELKGCKVLNQGGKQ